MLNRIFGAGRDEQAGFALYTGLVTAAREPFHYARLGVPDTLDGRFDLIALYAGLTIRRLQRAGGRGPRVAQALFDAMFSDMDISLREMGVGDLGVPKRVREMWEAFHGRALAYGAALDAGDAAALAAALRRNVWRGQDMPAGDGSHGDGPGPAQRLAAIALALASFLDGQDEAAMLAGRLNWPAAAGLDQAGGGL